MSEAYYLAAIPEPFTILGVRLQHFSPGKILLLHRVGSPFALGGTVTREQLESAIWLCSFPFREAEESLNNPDETIKEFRSWRKKLGAINLQEACARFEQYIVQGSHCPRFSPKGKPSDIILDVPTVQLVRCGLERWDESFWNEPWGQLLWDFFTMKGMEGAGDITDQAKAEEALEVANALQAALDKKAVSGA